MISSSTTLTTLICKTKKNFIIDYADYTDLQGYIKNDFIIDYADYTDLQD